MKTNNIKDNGVELKFACPGMEIEDIDINVTSKELSITLPENEFYFGKELSYRLSDILDDEKITAKLTKGVLTIFIPYLESKKPKKIKIE